MKKFITFMLVLSLLLTMLSFVGCNKNDDEIVIWIGGSIVGEDEVEEAQNTWIIQQLLDEYSQKTNKRIRLTYFEDEEAMVYLAANNERTGKEVPDIACIYSSEILRSMQDTIFPLESYLTQEEKENILFWDTVSLNGKKVDDADKILGYPIGGTEVTFIAYNKSIFYDAGLNVEDNPPQTASDFYNICETLHSSGVTPIVGSDDGWNEVYLQVFAKEWMQFVNDSDITEMAYGRKKFSDDTHLIQSLQTMQNYFLNDFINRDYATNEDAITLFANGAGGMFSCSNYDLNLLTEVMGNNLGVFALPDYVGDNIVYSNISFGGCNQCLSVFNSSKHKDDAIEIIHWLVNKENCIRMSQKFGCFPSRCDIALTEYDSNPSEIIQKIYPLIQYAHCTADYLMPLDIYAEFYRYSLLTVTGQMTTSNFVSTMDSLTK